MKRWIFLFGRRPESERELEKACERPSLGPPFQSFSLHPRESKKTASVLFLTVSQDSFYTWGDCLFFHPRILSPVNKSGRNFAPQRWRMIKKNSFGGEFFHLFYECETKRMGDKGLIGGCSCVLGARPWEVGWWTLMQAKVVQLSSDHKRTTVTHTWRHTHTDTRRWNEITGNQLFLKRHRIKRHWAAFIFMWHLRALLKSQLAFPTQKSITVFHPLIWNTRPRKWERPRSRSGKICSITVVGKK